MNELTLKPFHERVASGMTLNQKRSYPPNFSLYTHAQIHLKLHDNAR
ncbi:MAG: hypothetical protein LBE93_03560 [Enterobacter asburiae]|jgi:hypothetical protein|nr:hypothetical protein [Enterobacter asburiae]